MPGRRRYGRLGRAVPVLLMLAGAVACGGDGDGDGDGDSAVAAAEARVTAKQEDLADAKADLVEKSEAFCGASQTYILALDRYGDVLGQTAVTVGDVTDAGEDLESRRRTSSPTPRPPLTRSRPWSTQNRSSPTPRRR